MNSINGKSVLRAGAVAGVVMNVIDYAANYVSGGTLQRDLERVNPGLWRNVSDPGKQPAYFVVDFILAMLLVWLYAAIRPRFGPGPGTAIRAALVLWAFGAALWYLFVLMGLLSYVTFMIGGVTSAISFGVSALVGGKLYKEAD